MPLSPWRPRLLQVAQKSFTGHWANGGPLLSDGLDVTRHVAAGVAQALGGLVPPYVRFSAAHGSAAGDWLWGVGHHPFGPYSNCSGLRCGLLSDTPLVRTPFGGAGSLGSWVRGLGR